MRVSVGDVRLFFEVIGQEWALADKTPQRRPVLIGLHGGPGLDGSKLRYQLAPLADAAQVVVPDQRGHGRSDHGTAETWNLESWAADVKAFSEALEIERPVVLGVSFGGFVAQQYATAYPEHPTGLILISTGPRLGSIDETVERFREVGGDEAAAIVRRDWEAPTEETAAEWRRVCGPLLALRSDPELDRLRAARIETIDVNVHFMKDAKNMDLRDRLAAVRCPTLVVAGERDPLVPATIAREIVEAMPHALARLELIGEASHDVLADNPVESYRVIREFVAELGSG
jgi:pimeloyl-ACP methyl ester carboxylesterase